MTTSTTTSKRNNDDATIDGTNTNKKIKNMPEMSNIWETTLTGDDCGALHKAANGEWWTWHQVGVPKSSISQSGGEGDQRGHQEARWKDGIQRQQNSLQKE